MTLYAAYLSDEEMEGVCSEEQLIRHMLRFEAGLALAEARLGLIPEAAAQTIQRALSATEFSPAELAAGTLQNGIPTITLLSRIKELLPADVRNYLHLGATSQDVQDTAQVLMIREALVLLETRILHLLRNLLALIERHGTVPCMAHTRWQQATPIPFSLRVVNWAMPLVRSLERLQEMKRRLLVVQLGGASGSLAALGDTGYQVLEALADELKLAPSLPWHAQRDTMVEFTTWLALVSGTLGKMGADILLMAQTEVGEVVENAEGGGKSSAMPHKSNPVLSEALVALARINANLSALLMQSLVQTGERDGTAWMLEWQHLSQMIINTGTALKHALTISTGLQIDRERMRQNIALTRGLVYAEQAVVILSDYMPKSRATTLVNQACGRVSTETGLAQALTQLVPEVKLDWSELLQPEACFGSSGSIIQQATARIKDILTVKE
ncbi:adenylosuccinate lyase family protein [Telluribacter sp. SYSU D00476]|uniref:class-II fumarase/aspartase family protein n=1 Tax=Telluribacter sp. SYSU D00476 TaxID=2811430 RepID=UPI001FF6A07E|nr:adenylosuccinate lyase family protein [Telluribacter sp. SYSU D00476]